MHRDYGVEGAGMSKVPAYWRSMNAGVTKPQARAATKRLQEASGTDARYCENTGALICRGRDRDKVLKAKGLREYDNNEVEKATRPGSIFGS